MAAAGCAVVALGSVLPWATSGARTRSSHELVRVAARLDLVEGTPAVLVRAWHFVVLAAVVVVGLVLARRLRWAAVLAMVVGVSTLGLAFAVKRSPLEADVGLALSVLGAIVALSGAAGTLTLSPGRTHDRDRPT